MAQQWVQLKTPWQYCAQMMMFVWTELLGEYMAYDNCIFMCRMCMYDLNDESIWLLNIGI